MEFTESRYAALILAFSLTVPVLASDDTRGPNGIEATGLKMPDGTTDLTGGGIPVGQVERTRPPKDGLDSVTVINSGIDPEEVWKKTTMITQENELINDHATWVAGIAVHSGFGVAPSADLYAGAFETEGIEPGYSDALLTIQRIATRPNAEGTRVINNSWNKEINEIDTTDGNSLLSLGVDWLASQQDVLLVFAGNEGQNRPVPQDNYNGITVGGSAKVGTKV
jgi:hypothetical protein